MASLRVDGNPDDLERFSRFVRGSASIEVPSPFERHLRWRQCDRSGRLSSTVLRSGIELTASTVMWERPWAMAVEHAASPIKFILMRGPGPRVQTSDGDCQVLGGGAFSFGQIKRPVQMRFAFDQHAAGTSHEELSLMIDRSRLGELLGGLPDALTAVLSRPLAYPSSTQAMTPGILRRFDEIEDIMACNARGAARQLHLEGKGLELLAMLIDEIEAHARASSPQLSASDRDRLEHARQLLLARMQDPPSLADLARGVGLNGAKLKVGFRTLFGDTVYGYLRNQRMDAARRMLLERRYSVTEVAARVGYANPSKFAAAFRKRFGVSPSEVA